MPSFQSQFTVAAPVADVAAFHRDVRVLKALSPPPLFVRVHQFEPLAEGSLAEFTLWVGPLPIRWRARHSNVDPLHGFTDTQVKGPLASWIHTHHFEAISSVASRVTDEVKYTYRPGWAGWLSRLFFAPLPLRFLFFYRKLATRRGVKRLVQSRPATPV